MSFSVGIIGLPNVGKSTLFKVLTKRAVDISAYPFCTIDPNIGIVEVPDERLIKVAEIIKPQKITPTVIEFVDIAGLVKDAHKGEGLGNQFLAKIRQVDAILEVVRIFENPNVAHIEGTLDPERDIKTIAAELIFKDLETVEKRMGKIAKEVKAEIKNAVLEKEELNKIKKILDEGKLIRNEKTGLDGQLIKELDLLTAKPMIYLLNGRLDAESLKDISRFGLQDSDLVVALDFKVESELAELTDEEAEELEMPSSKLDELIEACYTLLDLITFYTIAGGKEARAWTLKRGVKAPRAGGVVHNDFEKGFIKAEATSWQDLVKAGSWSKARELGLVRTEGKEYIVQDGDIVEFKI